MEFPDTHHKMSKKIAQLTKVIYHLNTKNDESEALLKSLVDQYEIENAEVTTDARSKMSALSKVAEDRVKEIQMVKGALATLASQKDAEAAEANRRFDAFKVTAARNEDRLVKVADEKVGAMVREVSSMRDEFNEQVKAVAANASSSDGKLRDQMSEMRSKKDQEMEALVKEYNERYKSMMAKQMQERDEQKIQLDAEWSKKIEVWENKFKMEKKRGDEESAKAKALAEMRGEDTKKIQSMTAEMASMNEELSRLRGKEAMLNESVSSTLRQLTAAEGKSSQLGSELDSAEKQRMTLLAQLEGLRAQKGAEIDAIKAQQEEEKRRKAAELEALAATSAAEKDALLKRKAAELEALAAASAAEKEAMLKRQTALEKEAQERLLQLSSGARSLSDNVASLQAQCTALRSQLDAEQQSIALLKSQLVEMHSDKVTTAAEHEARVAALRSDYEGKLRAALIESRVSSSELTAAWEGRVKQREADLRAGFDAERKEMKKDHASEVEALVRCHEEEREALKKKLRDSGDALASLEQRIKSKEEEFGSQMKSSSTGAEESMRKLRAELEEAKATAGKFREDTATDRAAAAEFHANAIKTLQKEIGGLKSALEASDKSVEELKRQLGDTSQIKAAEEAVRIKLEQQLNAAMASHAAEKQRLQEELSKMNAAHVADTKRMRDELAKTSSGASEAQMSLRRQLEEDATRRLAAAQERAAEENAAEVARGKAALVEEQRRKAAAEAELMSRLARLDELSSQRFADVEIERREREAAWSAETKELREKIAAAEREGSLRLQEAVSESDRKLRATRQDHEAVVKLVQEDSAKAMGAVEERWSVKLRDRGVEHDRQREEDAKKAAVEREKALAELQRQHLKIVEGLQADIAKAETEWQNVRQKLLEATKEIEHGKLNESNLRGEMDRQRQEAESRLQESIKRLQTESAKVVAQLRNEHALAMQGKGSEVEALKVSIAQIMQRSTELEELLAQVEYKYANRESRSEDVAKINELMKEVKEQQEVLLRTHQEMLRYKLELVNKEESYNKLFGKHPKVAGGAGPMPPQGGFPTTASFPVGAGTNVPLTNGRRMSKGGGMGFDDPSGPGGMGVGNAFPGGVQRVDSMPVKKK